MSKQSAYFNLSEINGKHSLKKLKKELDTLKGVSSIIVNVETNKLVVDYDSTGVSFDKIEKQINNMGYEIVSSKNEDYIM